MTNPVAYYIEEAMRLPEWFDTSEARTGARKLALERRILNQHYEEAVEASAQAEREYDKQLAARFTTHRASGKGVQESEILARGDCEEAKYNRALAGGRVKAIALHMTALDGERANFRQICEWSMQLERGQ